MVKMKGGNNLETSDYLKKKKNGNNELQLIQSFQLRNVQQSYFLHTFTL